MYLEAILFGLLLGIAAGPVSIAMIELAIQGGKKPAFSLAAGVWLGDITFVLMTFFGLSFISEIPGFHFYLGICGGVILLLFGLMSIFLKPKKLETQLLSASSYVGFFMKGYAINILNPFVFVFWIGVIGNLSKRSLEFSDGLLYIATILVTLSMTDIVKIFVSDFIREYMNDKQFRVLRIISGIGLIGFGISLIWRVI